MKPAMGQPVNGGAAGAGDGQMGAQAARPRWSTATKWIVVVCLLAILGYGLSRFSVVIAPLTIALLIAYLLSPLVGRVERGLRIRRGWATLLVYLVLIGVASLLPVLLVPTLVDQVTRLNLNFQDMIRWVETFLSQEIAFGEYTFNLAEMVQRVSSTLRGLLEPVVGQTFSIVIQVISSLAWGVFILVVSFYLTKDADQLSRWLDNLPPPSYREDLRRLRTEVNALWSAFLRGQVVLAFVVTVIFIIGGLILGIPYALVLALFAGLLEFVPSVGHEVWLTIASMVVLFKGSTWIPVQNWVMVLILIGVHIVYQQIDINFLIPHIVGRRLHLHPLVIILGVVVGASLAGVLGVVLAIPVIGTLRLLGRYVSANLSDVDPFAGIEPPPDEAEGGAGRRGNPLWRLLSRLWRRLRHGKEAVRRQDVIDRSEPGLRHG